MQEGLFWLLMDPDKMAELGGPGLERLVLREHEPVLAQHYA